MAKAFDAYHRWLGIPPEDQPPNHYRLLGISLFEKLPEVIESAADQRMVHLRSFQTGPNSDESQKLLNEVSAARLCLLKPDTKSRYDRLLKTKIAKDTPAAPPPIAAARNSLTGKPKAVAAVATPLAAEGESAAVEVNPLDFTSPTPSASADWQADAMRLGTVGARRSKSAPRKSAAPMLALIGVPTALVVVGLVVAVAMNSNSGNSAQGDSEESGQVAAAQPKNAKEVHSNDSSAKELPKLASLSVPSSLPLAHKNGSTNLSDQRTLSNSNSHGPGQQATGNANSPESELADIGISAADLARRQQLKMPTDDGPSKSTDKNANKNSSSKSSSSSSGGTSDSAAPADSADAKPKTTVRLPVPDEAAQQKALQQLKDLLKDDYAGAKTSETQVALADKLKQLAIDTKNDPNSIYVMLAQALDLLSKSGDPVATMSVVETLVKSFDVDAWDLRQKTLVQLAHAAKTEDVRAAVIRSAIELADQANSDNRFDAGLALATTAMNLSAAVKDNALRDEARELTERTKRLQKEQPTLEAALKTLKTNPNDAEANLAVGRFKCFLVGDWPAGLPYLSKGNDEALKALAKQEEGAPAAAEDQAKLADAWWDLSEKKGDRKDDPVLKTLRARAIYWYRLALPNLSGLSLAKAQKRVDSEDAGKPEAPITETVYLDDLPELDLVLANLSLGKHGDTGYSRTGGRPTVVGGGKKGRITINPGAPPPPQRVVLAGVEATHALSLQPRPSGNATVAYDVGGKYRLFNGTSAIMDGANPTSAVLFRVLADGKQIWVSRPMRRAGESQTCTLKIGKAKKLEFEILCNGANGGALTAWINPAVGR